MVDGKEKVHLLFLKVGPYRVLLIYNIIYYIDDFGSLEETYMELVGKLLFV